MYNIPKISDEAQAELSKICFADQMWAKEIAYFNLLEENRNKHLDMDEGELYSIFIKESVKRFIKKDEK